MNTLYQAILMDHYRNPRNKGTLAKPDMVSDQYNPSCGDSIQFHGVIEASKLTDIAFQAQGCVLSVATASLLSEQAKNKPVQEILAWDKQRVFSLIGMELGPVRIKCALLPLQALQEGIIHYQSQVIHPFESFDKLRTNG